MDALPLILRFWIVLWFTSFGFSSSYYPSWEVVVPKPEEAEGRPMTFTYSRFPEVEEACAPILSTASQFKPGSNRPYDIRSQMAFVNGDWAQESHGAPLMPFDSRDARGNSSSLPAPLYLASFRVMDVDPHHRSSVAMNVSGVLTMSISRNVTSSQNTYLRSPQFQMWAGYSQLAIIFEGVYVESEMNGGEVIMCLLGTALLPSRGADSDDPWEWMKGSVASNYRPPLVQDDRILLVLRYPKAFTLTSRAVKGEMRSLHKSSKIGYFDMVNFSSQLGAYSNYQFGSEKIVSKACNPDELFGGELNIYRGFGFCGILERFASEQVLSVAPNWNCNSTDEYCRKLGPFESEKGINATDGSFKNVRLTMQDVRCEPRQSVNSHSSARVSGVFRVIPPWENRYAEAQRTSLTGLTLAAEGIWNSLSGQLCMAGCLGSAQARCDSRICLYVPISFSIRQRNIIIGSISSIDKSKEISYFPLSFERRTHPSELWNEASDLHMSYNYSKLELAGALLDGSEPFDFGKVIKKSFLSYPKKEEDGDEYSSFSKLWDDLTLHISAVSDPSTNVQVDRAFIQMEILSLGSLFGRYWTSSNVSDIDVGNQRPTNPVASERELLVNVAAEFTASGKLYSNISSLSLEGLYNQVDGKMYLIGCRDVRASWKTLFDSMDLEDGLDCLIEVKIEYPPTTARWLINPTALISIQSSRNEDDPLYFKPVKLQTLPILYREQREDILSRKGVEGILRIMTLSLAIGCILSQLFYIRDNTGVVPYISHVMLGVQALGYSIPLITGAEALFARLRSEPYENPSYDLEKNQGFQIMDYFVKVLVLGAFLLTLRLGQKVWKSRIRLLTRAPLEPGRVPNDKQVLVTCSIIHGVGFLIILIVHSITASHRPIQSEVYMDSRGHSHKLREWGIELEEYVGLIQDFFLLPQIIGNFLWQIDCKPLRTTYYMGITVVRLLPHVYDYIRAPVVNPYFSEEYEFVNPSLDFYSKFGDIAIPATAIMLVLVVYLQQRWNYQMICQKLGSGRKLLSMGSRVYQRLPSMSTEAELVVGVNGTEAPGHSHKDEA